MGNDGKPRPGYDRWVSFDGHGQLDDPKLNIDGAYVQKSGYITDLLNNLAIDFIKQPRKKPFSLFFAHKAVHPDAVQAADGTLQVNGYRPATRHKDLYKGSVFPKYPNMLSPAQVVKQKPAWADAFELKKSDKSKALLESLHAGGQEEIRLRAAMMASVDEGVGMIFDALERNGQLDDTMIIFLGDNGYFFGEHGLGPERRFAYEAGIRSPFVVRYPEMIRGGTRVKDLIICQDIAPTLIELAGGRPGPQVQGKSLQGLFDKKKRSWRKSFLVEYWAEQALPWLVGMTYKAVRTDRYKLIHWVNRGKAGELDELYDLEKDPWEMKNLIASRAHAAVRQKLRKELGRLVAAAVGL
jgi:N-acetylglucosamine-6-sulfatase